MEAVDFSEEKWFPDFDKWPKFEFLFERDALTLYAREGRLDVLLITVNPKELNAAIQKFCVGSKVIHKANIGLLTVYFGLVGKDNLTFGIVKQTDMGPFGQQTVVNEARKLNPCAIISMGVGWGNKGKLQSATTPKSERGELGDVMVASTIVEFAADAKIYENGKIKSRSSKPSTGKRLFARFTDSAMPGQWRFPRY